MSEAQLTVLVVDDTPENIDLLTGILRDSYLVKAATNGERALKIVAGNSSPDIILLDVMMPGMSGHDVCRQLKSDPATAEIPVIFVTAKADAKDELEGLALGAVDYITKPFNPVIVKARVATHLALRAGQLDLKHQNRLLKESLSGGFVQFDSDDIERLTKSPEGIQLEFKSTLRWNLAADRADKKIENQCLKTVASFLNTDGGALLIGVDDSGKALGLAHDQFATEDKMLLHWNSLLKAHLGVEFLHLIKSEVRDLGEQRLMLVQCRRSTRPVFFRRENDESFFVRTGNGTQGLKPSEVLAYIEQRLPSRDAS